MLTDSDLNTNRGGACPTLGNTLGDCPVTRESTNDAAASGQLTVLGWREWVSLPELGIDRVKCKVDTGARTSTLHAHYVEKLVENERERVRFGLHPRQRRTSVSIECVADIFDERIVSDSGGHRERRFIIKTLLQLGTSSWPIELTLTDRDTMRFRMLLGRTAMQERYVVDPSKSYLVGKRRLSTGGRKL